MNIIVESEADYNAWLAKQKTVAEQNTVVEAAPADTLTVTALPVDTAATAKL